jgi:chromosomal replication initiation ATPase DnaA
MPGETFTGRTSSVVELKIHIKRLQAEIVDLRTHIGALETQAKDLKSQAERRRLRRRSRVPSAHLPPLDYIIGKTAEEFCLSMGELTSVRREVALIEPRHVAIHLCCRMRPDMTVPQIAQCFHRDHTTLIHANRKIIMRRQADAEYDQSLTDMENEIVAEHNAAPLLPEHNVEAA